MWALAMPPAPIRPTLILLMSAGFSSARVGNGTAGGGGLVGRSDQAGQFDGPGQVVVGAGVVADVVDPLSVGVLAVLRDVVGDPLAPFRSGDPDHVVGVVVEQGALGA